MALPEQSFDRGLNQETLARVTNLSNLRDETGSQFTVIAKAVGPFTDEIRVRYPNGLESTEFIEEAIDFTPGE